MIERDMEMCRSEMDNEVSKSCEEVNNVRQAVDR